MSAFKLGISVLLFTVGAAPALASRNSETRFTAFSAYPSPFSHVWGDSSPAVNTELDLTFQQPDFIPVVAQQRSLPGRPSSNGIFGSLFGGSESAPKSRSTGQTSPQPSAGLLGRMSNGGANNGSMSRDSGGKDDGRKVIEPAPQTGEPDWTNVPFHSPKNVPAAKNNQPITDPKDPSNRNLPLAARTTTQSKVPTPPAATQARTATQPPANTKLTTPQQAPSKPLAAQVPVPPAERAFASRESASTAPAPTSPSVSRTTVPEINTSTYEPLSPTDSSRRPRRRSMSPLEVQANELAAASELRSYDSEVEKAATRTAQSDSIEAEPRINRKQLAAGNSSAAATPITSPAKSDFPPTIPAQTVSNRPVDQALVPPSLATEPPSNLDNGLNNNSTSSNTVNNLPTTLQRSDSEYKANTQSANTQSANTQSANTQPTSMPATTAPAPASDAWRPATQALVNVPAGNSVGMPVTSAAQAANESKSLGVTANESFAPPSQPVNTVSVNSDANNIIGEIPGLRVITSGPADIPVRQSIAYSIVIENMSNLDAPGAMVQVKLPIWVAIQNHQPTRGEVAREDDASTRHLLWMVEGLPANSREEIVLNLSATEAKSFDVETEWAIIPKASTARVTVREPKLDLIIEGPDQVVFGESQTYKVRVINPGTGPSESVVFTLSPNSATPQSQRIGVIPPGKEAQFEVELTARDMDNLQIHGLASGDSNLKAEKIKSIQVVRAQLEAVLTGPVVKYQDAVATYNLQLLNQGSAGSKNVTASLRLPAGCQYLGGIDNAQQTGNQLTWNIPELPSDGSVEYNFSCKMTQTGEHKFDFACQGSALGKASIDFVTQVEAVADLVLTIDDPAAPAPVGKEVVYEIIVRNRGSKAAEMVSVLAQFSNHIEPIRIEGADGEITPGQVKFAPVPKIEAGQQASLKIFAKAETAGNHRFCTEVSCGETLLISEQATRYIEMTGTRVSRRSSDSNLE